MFFQSVAHEYLKQTLRRPPDPSEWEGFILKAALVTSFKRFGPAPDLEEDAYRTLCLYRPDGEALLPNLQELVWEESDADVFEYGFQFLAPKLTTLHIGQPPSDTLLLPILRGLHVKCPLLRHLSIQCRSSVGPTDTVVSRAVMQLSNLESVDLCLPLSDDTLFHLATLPNLSAAKLFIHRNSQLHERLAATTSPIFPSLVVLHISVVQVEPWLITVINLVTTSQLSEIQLCAAHDPTHAVLRGFLSALTSSPSQDTISTVRLCFPLPSSIPMMRSLSAIPPLDDPERVLAPSIFEPLEFLPDLVELDITSFFLLPTDAFIQSLSAACPQLQVLRIASPYNIGVVPLTTLDGVLDLLRTCSDLTHLTLPFNAALPYAAPALSALSPSTSFPVFDPSPQSRPDRANSEDFSSTSSQLLVLDVCDAPIHEPTEVAAILSAYCTHPDFEIIAARGGDGDNAPERVRAREEHAALWARTTRLVHMFALVRREERAHWSSLWSTRVRACGCPCSCSASESSSERSESRGTEA